MSKYKIIQTNKSKIENWVQEGKGQQEIANILNVTRGSIKYWMKKWNLKTSYHKYRIPVYGEEFGGWVFIKEAGFIKNKMRWTCKCKKCGKEKDILYWHILGRNKYKSKSCGCDQFRQQSLRQWQGYEEISKTYWQSIHKGAKKRKLEINITIEYIWDLFLKQDRKCALSGIELFFPPKIGLVKNKNKQTASLDRIDNNKGYIEGNVQWIHTDINYIKQDYTEKELLYYIIKIYKYQKELGNI